MDAATAQTGNGETPAGGNGQVLAVRAAGWVSVALLGAYLINIVLTIYLGIPGVTALGGEDGAIGSFVVLLAYAVAIVLPIIFVARTPGRGLRADAAAMSALVNFIIRAAFWSVVLIGVVDAAISFLRVEGFLTALTGEALAGELGRSHYRGTWIHIPLVAIGFLLALRTRTLGFQWLALLVVLAELVIVIGRFVFSYEQAFQGDLVRFWYGALFLFASAYTLFDDGHVRVDVLYAGMSDRAKGKVNAIGSVLLGLALCWVVLYFGMGEKSSIVNSAMLSFEVSQSGFGMYVKYWMASFLAVFAVTMAIQFTSTFVEGVADWRGDPGKRETTPTGGQ
ncbi:TRAP transporter small permease subunit [Marivibrio halodurans]|uniref:TRAP transporter small permease protein n=1 Tax=Marivibrio halodurans TaxID=2039722 RepID=A0A8J7RWS0_9PROT|nr:TRAP transporter small permease subunit [Marivibrio halodurans]MBP5855935.1 TRAP transporter small permease subunit [Marivibrio halodurans]